MKPDGKQGSVDATERFLTQAGYVADRALATVVFLARALERPLFLEGEAGVGKTELALALSRAFECRLIRLQCHEGLDIAGAVYEWNYAAQMIEIRLAEAAGGLGDANRRAELERTIYSEQFLIRRPLLEAFSPHPEGPPVLLIDEIDRADEPFEAFLLEALSAYQVTIPEIGTVKAETLPFIILTSNRTREVHDALKRRCLYHWIDYPDAARELAILKQQVPEALESLSREIVAFAGQLRGEDLFKKPGVAETIDWARALTVLNARSLDPESVSQTLGVILKYEDDLTRIRDSDLHRRIEEAQPTRREKP